MHLIDCIECGHLYDPQFCSGDNFGLCNDCFDTLLDCKTCGDCFDNDPDYPVDNCPECDLY